MTGVAMTRKHISMMGPLLAGLLVATLMSVLAIADAPIASSSFVGAENPLSENGAWVAVMAYSPYGTLSSRRTTAPTPTDSVR